MMETHHTPVMFKETLDYLVTDKSGTYFDATLGFGGHSEGILNLLNDDAKLISTDVDADAFKFSREKFKSDQRMKLYNYNFSQIDIIAKIESIKKFTGVFADLGVSSFQLDNPASGFTYREDAKLDLRMDKSKAISAADIINTFPEEKLANIIYEFGEEKNSRKIAKKICEERSSRRIETTGDIVRIVGDLTPPNFRIKTLSRVFQALRIYINDELEVLKSFLKKSVDLLEVGGRIVVLSYHSLEDRIVKESFKYEAIDCICPKEYPVCRCDKESRLKILTKKPLSPQLSEVRINFRARSAKLRAAERVYEKKR